MARNARKNNRFLPELLIGLGVIFTLISVTHNLLRLRSLQLDRQIVQSYHSEIVRSDTRPIPTHIYIQWFVDVAIEPHVYQDDRWTVSDTAGSYLLASAKPGESGNIIVYGHNKRSILGNIRALKGSELITLGLSDGTSRTYKIETITEVSPTDTRLLEPTSREVLTLYTCSGFLDSQRVVVTAVPVTL